MDSTQYEYLRLNKYLLFTIGIWPYQTTLQRSLVAIVFIPIIVAQVILQVLMHIVKQIYSTSQSDIGLDLEISISAELFCPLQRTSNYSHLDLFRRLITLLSVYSAVR